MDFYLFTLEAEIYENNLFYDKSKDALENAQNILLKNESAYTENRYGTVLLNLSNCYIFLFQFDQAINLALESKRLGERAVAWRVEQVRAWIASRIQAANDVRTQLDQSRKGGAQ